MTHDPHMNITHDVIFWHQDQYDKKQTTIKEYVVITGQMINTVNTDIFL